MVLPDSVTDIRCQTCGNSWKKADANTAFYFTSASFSVGSMTSPFDIDAAAELMLFCPKCDVGRLQTITDLLGGGDAMEDARTDPDGLDKERAGTGGAEVVHRGRNTRE